MSTKVQSLPPPVSNLVCHSLHGPGFVIQINLDPDDLAEFVANHARNATLWIWFAVVHASQWAYNCGLSAGVYCKGKTYYLADVLKEDWEILRLSIEDTRQLVVKTVILQPLKVLGEYIGIVYQKGLDKILGGLTNVHFKLVEILFKLEERQNNLKELRLDAAKLKPPCDDDDDDDDDAEDGCIDTASKDFTLLTDEEMMTQLNQQIITRGVVTRLNENAEQNS